MSWKDETKKGHFNYFSEIKKHTHTMRRIDPILKPEGVEPCTHTALVLISNK